MTYNCHQLWPGITVAAFDTNLWHKHDFAEIVVYNNSPDGGNSQTPIVGVQILCP
jgi:hypothetical protein